MFSPGRLEEGRTCTIQGDCGIMGTIVMEAAGKAMVVRPQPTVKSLSEANGPVEFVRERIQKHPWR